MMVVVAAIVLMLLIKAFVVQVYRIPSSSMEDTCSPATRVLVNKLVYHVRGIARGDIVVFSGDGSWGTTTGAPDPSPPGNPLLRVAYDVLADVGVYSTQTYYIKRVIGLPGDHVVCCVNGKVTVNGVPLNEASYLFPGASPSMQSGLASSSRADGCGSWATTGPSPTTRAGTSPMVSRPMAPFRRTR